MLAIAKPAIALLVAFAAIPASAQPQEGNFGDWSVGCSDDVAYCAALTASSVFTLRIGRHADDAHWDISILADGGFPAQPPTLRVLVDDRGIEFGKNELIWADGNDELFFVGDAAQELFDQLISGSSAAVETGANTSIEFSLTGLSASLLWIDEGQGRVGDARIVGVSRSEGPSLGFDAALATPSVVPSALLEQHARQSNCDPIDDLVHGDDWQIYALTDGNILYMIPCFAGAYNFSYMIYLGRAVGDGFDRLLFVDFVEGYGWIGADQLVGAFFDPVTLRLSSFYKGRGLADCGTSGVWTWDRYAFRLNEFYAKTACDGTIEPGGFPQIWPN